MSEWRAVRSKGARTAPRTRTCIATRAKLHDTQLLRVVAREITTDGAQKIIIIPDPSRSLPGRGAWIVPTRENYAIACERRAFQRALRVPAQADTHHVGEYIEVLLAQRPDDSHKTKGRPEH